VGLGFFGAMMNFPCWMYHAEHGARLFADAEEFAAAGFGWADNPAAAEELAYPLPRVGHPVVKRGKR
jgi:hypothetical protein